MSMEIRKSGTAFNIPKRKAAKEKDFLGFVAQLPCIISGRPGVEVCHVSFANPQYGAYGRGKGSKASDRWVLPMTRDMHSKQHSMNERLFWESHHINPHFCCLVLYGLFNEAGMDALPEAEAFIRAREFQP